MTSAKFNSSIVQIGLLQPTRVYSDVLFSHMQCCFSGSLHFESSFLLDQMQEASAIYRLTNTVITCLAIMPNGRNLCVPIINFSWPLRAI